MRKLLILSVISIVCYAPPLRHQVALVNVASQMIGKRVLDLTNQFRRNQGLRPLQWDPTLFQVAQKHARQMASGSAPFSHQGLNERFQDVKRIEIRRMGPSARVKDIGENLFHAKFSSDVRQPVARIAVNRWKKSPPHRANMLKPNFNYGGVGVAKNGQGHWYMTQLFSQKNYGVQ